jgi:single-stranded DNA-specific DHH superfamily exonuclease
MKCWRKKIKVDCKVDFELIDNDLISSLKEFEPVGLGNPQPVFETNSVILLDANL